MICDQWEVVAVPFPFMDRPAAKRRPALVLSNKNFNANNDHSILAMITRAKSDSWQSDYKITKPAQAGLNVECYVRWKVFTLPNSLIVKKIGILASADRASLEHGTKTIFSEA